MKLTTPHIVIKDPIPEKTEIYFSKTKLSIALALWIAVFIAGIYFLTMGSDRLALALLCMFLSTAFVYFKVEMLKDESPQIILSDKGIQQLMIIFICGMK